MFFFNNKKIEISKLLNGFIDYHSHILPSVDDGVDNMQESLDILSYFEQLGIRKVILTPHINAQSKDDIDQFLENRFNELLARYSGNVKLHLAAEYMLDLSFEKRIYSGLKYIDDNRVLVETSYVAPPKNLPNLLYELVANGNTPIIAHPERYMYMSDRNYKELKNKGCQFQLNILSLCDFYGKGVKEKSTELLKKGMYDVVGTDIHSLAVFKSAVDSKRLPEKQIVLLKELIK